MALFDYLILGLGIAIALFVTVGLFNEIIKKK